MLGIVVGLAAEARLARGLGGTVVAGGGDGAGARAAAERLVAGGAKALLSFGLAGGLAPELQPGAIVVPASVVDRGGRAWATDEALARRFGTRAGSLLASGHILGSAEAKHAAWQGTGALAVDMESGAVAAVAAAAGLPFAVLRAVCDPADRTLAPAALGALDGAGRIRPWALARSLAGNPWQIPGLIALGRDAARARAALLACVSAARPTG